MQGRRDTGHCKAWRNGQTELGEGGHRDLRIILQRPGLLRIPAGFRHLSSQDAETIWAHSGGAANAALRDFPIGKNSFWDTITGPIRETRLSEHPGTSNRLPGHHKTVLCQDRRLIDQRSPVPCQGQPAEADHRAHAPSPVQLLRLPSPPEAWISEQSNTSTKDLMQMRVRVHASC